MASSAGICGWPCRSSRIARSCRSRGQTGEAEFNAAIAAADAVVHLAGVNRPQDPADFVTGNVGFTARLCDALRDAGRAVPIAFASSIQARAGHPYGASKRAAEERLQAHARETGAPVAIYRLPNVFGKWCRPNYNSAVATFCHNIARGLPIRIDDPAAEVRLVYIDDVVAALLAFLVGAARRRRLPGRRPRPCDHRRRTRAADRGLRRSASVAGDRARGRGPRPRAVRDVRQLPAAGILRLRAAEARRRARRVRGNAEDARTPGSSRISPRTRA